MAIFKRIVRGVVQTEACGNLIVERGLDTNSIRFKINAEGESFALDVDRDELMQTMGWVK